MKQFPIGQRHAVIAIGTPDQPQCLEMTHDDTGILPRRSYEEKKRPSRWQRRLLGAVCVLAGVILLALAGLHWYHPRMLYRPETVPSSEADYFARYPNLKVELDSLTAPDGVKLCAYWFPSSKAGQPVLYFLYGSDGNMGYAVEHVHQSRKYADWNVLLLAYRGYGFSEGRPSMSGIQMDVETGLNYLLTNMSFSRDKIIVYGHSFGGAAALHLAAKRPASFGTLIVESTFVSVREMASLLFPKWSWLSFLITENWDNRAQIDELIRRAA